MSAFTVVDVIPDTPLWEAARRESLGASEIAAVMNLSPWGTALDIYKSKHGVDKDFDPVLAFIGHESESIIHKWVEKHSGLTVRLEPSFMARSVEFPFLHASFDRISRDPFTTWQFKTAHQYAGHHWDEGIPTDIRVQVQSEMLVAGTTRAAVVVWIGGREFRLFWENRDDKFITTQLVPTITEFWSMVQDGTPPPPSNMLEVSELWPSETREVEATEDIFEIVEQRAVHLSDINAMQEEADQMKLAISLFMEDADTLTFQKRKVLTNRSQKGRTSFDKAKLEADHPEIVAAYTRQGADFKVMRTMKEKSNG